MTWIVRLSGFTSVRPDGAKVGAFWPGDGSVVWWGYTPDGIPSGPHQSRIEAQAAIDAALHLEIAS